MRVVVIGGTGLIGSKLVPILSQQGHESVAASLKTGVNTLTCEALAEVLEDTQVVVDASNSPSFEAKDVMDFFTTSTTNLLQYAARAGVGHLVALSVVGAQRLVDSGYIPGKIAQERLIEEGKLPYSIVHATQFFEFVNPLADLGTRGGQVHLAPVFIQPMAANDVAKAVGRISVGTPLDGVVEVAGRNARQRGHHADGYVPSWWIVGRASTQCQCFCLRARRIRGHAGRRRQRSDLGTGPDIL